MLITLDTLRYDGLIPDETNASPMPTTFARARQGSIFERFYASTSITQPSHASMFTALHPWEHGVVTNGQILEERWETVAEVLRKAGFATEAVVASFPVAARFGFAQGFDGYIDDFAEEDLGSRNWAGYEVAAGFYSLGDRITDAAIGRIEAATAQRQFFWFHYFDPHAPYGDSGDGPVFTTQRAYDMLEVGTDVSRMLRQFRRLYDEDLAALDRQLDRLLARLEADGDRVATHVVLVSDHGESFGEAGAIGHGMRLTPEQIRVPLVILSPRVEPGRHTDVASSVDVARTLLSLAGVELPDGVDDGPWARARDLTDPATGVGRALGMRRAFSDESTVEVRADGTRRRLDRHLFYAVGREGRLLRGNARTLVDPPADDHYGEQVRRLFARLERAVETGVAPATADRQTLEAMGALGYLQ